MKPLYLKDFKKIMTCGCGEPDCKNPAKWVHARCHKYGGVYIALTKNTINLHCFQCGNYIVSLFVDKISPHKNITIDSGKVTIEIKPPFECETPDCKKDSGLNIKFNNDIIETYCNTCKEFSAYIYLSKEPD